MIVEGKRREELGGYEQEKHLIGKLNQFYSEICSKHA